MKIEIEIIKTGSEHRDKLILESTTEWENHVKVNDDYFINIDELILALKALRKPLLARNKD